MKTLFLLEPFKMEFRDIPKPKIEDYDDILVKIIITGICGSDIHMFLGESIVKYPHILGHEMVAEVAEIGSGVKDFVPGDHVILDPFIGCGHCYPCSISRPNICENLETHGGSIHGCMREYMIIKQNILYKISKDIPWEKAALVEPFSIAGQSTSRANITAGDVVYVAGSGPIGLCILLMCKTLGATVVISDFVESRLVLAKNLGADFTINLKSEKVEEAVKKMPICGFTAAFDAVGHPTILPQLVNLVLPCARIVTIGFSKEPSRIAIGDITTKELTILGSQLSANQFNRIISLFENGRLDGTPLITGVYAFDDVIEVFKNIEENKEKNCKVLIRIGS
jgi:L-gulonate 5-dehydrogenase